MDSPKILVIEDSPLSMELVTDLLEINGYKVLQAIEARTGIDIAVRVHPDLILMDVQLPGMDGLELTRRLRRDPALGGVQIVALTAYAMKGDAENAFSAGCNGYITKPIDTRTFVNTVSGYLHRAADDRLLSSADVAGH